MSSKSVQADRAASPHLLLKAGLSERPQSSGLSGLVALVRQCRSCVQRALRALRPRQSSGSSEFPCIHAHGRVRPSVSRAVHLAAGSHLTDTDVSTRRPELLTLPLWDVEVRHLAFLLNTKEVTARRISSVLVREVARLAHLRGQTLNDAVAEALQLWAWHELNASLRSADVSADSEGATSSSLRSAGELMTAARRREWTEIDALLSGLRVS